MSSLLILSSLLGFQDSKANESTPPVESSHIKCVSFDATGSKVLCASQRGELFFWSDLEKAPTKAMLPRVPNATIGTWGPSSAVLTADGSRALVIFNDGRMFVWNTRDRSIEKELTPKRKRQQNARRSPDGNWFGYVAKDKQYGPTEFVLLKAADWTEGPTWTSSLTFDAFCFSHDMNSVFASVGYPTHLRHMGFTGLVEWDLVTGREIAKFEFGDDSPGLLKVSPDRKWLAVGTGKSVQRTENSLTLSGGLIAFDWKAKKPFADLFSIQHDYLRALTMSGDGKIVVGIGRAYSGGQAIAELHAFRVGDWKNLWTTKLDGPSHILEAAPVGNRLIAADGKYLYLLNVATGVVDRKVLKIVYAEDELAEFKKRREGN